MSLDLQFPPPSASYHSASPTSARGVPPQQQPQPQPQPQQPACFPQHDSVHSSGIAPAAAPPNQASWPPRRDSSSSIGARIGREMQRVSMPLHYIPRPRQMREKFQARAEGTSAALLLGWIASAAVATLVPLITWAVERGRYNLYYGRYNQYEQNQRNYENGNYYNGGGQGGDGNWNGNYNGYRNMCEWWNIACKYRVRRYQQQWQGGQGGGGGGGEEQWRMRSMLPSWYFFFGGSVQGDEREREEMGVTQNEGPMIFVYLATLALFLGLAVVGFRSLHAGKDRAVVIAPLLIFGLFTYLNLLTAVQGTVQTSGRMFENSAYGWAGQWSVLVASTDVWLMIFCLVWAGVLGAMQCADGRAERRAAALGPEADVAAALEMGYRAEPAPAPLAIEDARMAMVEDDEPTIRTERVQRIH